MVSSVPERAIRVCVEQVFYKTWWFILVVLTTAFGVAWVEWRRRVRHLKHIYQVRKRIADDLHDDVAASLNYLSMLVKSLHQRTEAGIERTEIAGGLPKSRA